MIWQIQIRREATTTHACPTITSEAFASNKWSSPCGASGPTNFVALENSDVTCPECRRLIGMPPVSVEVLWFRQGNDDDVPREAIVDAHRRTADYAGASVFVTIDPTEMASVEATEAPSR